MQRLSRMQERTVDTQTVHRGLDLPSHLPTLAHSADNQFPALAHATRDAIHGPGEILLRSRVGLVDVFEVGEGSALRGYDMDCRDDGRDVFGLGIGRAGWGEGP